MSNVTNLKKKSKIGIIAEINQCLVLLKLKACEWEKRINFSE